MQQPPPRDPRPSANAGQWVDQQVARLVPSWSWRAALYGTALFVLLVAICGRFGAGTQNSQTNAPAATQTTPAQPTAKLGDTVAAFDAALGSRVDAETWSASIGGQPAYLMISTQPGTDGSERAVAIVIGPPPELLATETWDLATMSSYLQHLLPSDATPAGTESGPNGATVHDLHSDQLSATFPASTFTNDPGTHQVAAGSLNWSCFLASPQGGSGVNQCQISVGTYS